MNPCKAALSAHRLSRRLTLNAMLLWILVMPVGVLAEPVLGQVVAPVAAPAQDHRNMKNVNGRWVFEIIVLFALTLVYLNRTRLLQARLGSTRDTLTEFCTLVDHNRAGILVLDADGTILYSNPAVSRLLSSTKEKLLGSPFGIPSVSNANTELNIMRADGSAGIAAVSVTEAKWHGQFAYLVMLYDITERKQVEEQVREFAFEDSLTGLPNRNLFVNRLEEAVKYTHRYQHGFALLFMDLNGFKGVNDTLGHGAGDTLLRAVAQRLTEAMRASDTLARMGGDEFTAILPEVTQPQDAEKVASKIQALFDAPFQLEGQERCIGIGISIGISICPTHSTDSRELLSLADTAMYHAKDQQQGGFSCYRSDMTHTTQLRLELEQELRGALLREEFTLLFQPQIDLKSGTYVAAEALLRWKHPKRGLVAPDSFLTTLESSDLIVDVGRHVLSMACQQLRDWQDRLDYPLPIVVNISPLQLERSCLVDDIATALSHSGIDPGLLIVELPEIAMFATMVTRRESLQRVVDLGVELHVDNFGTGYGSLDMLRQMPISAVKIDRSVVARLGSRNADRALIQGIITIAHGLDKRVIAAGIETEDQRRILMALGCEQGQGHLISPSVSAEQIIVWP